VFDFSATKLTAPTTGKVWAYNLLAPTALGSNSAETGIEMPSIVIKLVNVTVTRKKDQLVQVWGDGFVTINNFYDKNKSNAHIKQLEQGRIYSIPKIEFSVLDDVTEEPPGDDDDDDDDDDDEDSKSVLVEIELLDWETVSTGYDFN
jgi:phosphopantothenoylcysteine synthetase/decarboxylase